MDIALVLLGASLGALLTLGLLRPTRRRPEGEPEQRLFGEIARRTTNAVVVTDRERRITWANKAFSEISGYTLDEVLGRSPGELLQGPETNAKTVAEIRRCLQESVSFRGEILNYTKQGQRYWLSLDIHPLRDENGSTTGFMAIESDVTELAESRRRLDAQLEALDRSQCRVEFTPQGSVLGANAQFLAAMGCSKLELLGTSFRQLWIEEPDGPWARASVGKSTQQEFLLLTPQGEQRRASGVLCPVLSFDGTVEKVVLYCTDKTAEYAAQTRLELATAAASIGLWDWDVRTGRAYFNQALQQHLGQGGEEWNDWQSYLDSIHPEDRPGALAQLEAHLEGSADLYSHEHRVRTKEGAWLWVRDVGRAVDRPAEGRPSRILGLQIEVQALREAKEVAEHASKTKTDFLANMSHEIRTPMTAILGFAESLAEQLGEQLPGGTLQGELLEMVEIIQSNGDHLLRIINDILDVSKIEAGKMEVESIATNPVRVVGEVADLMRGKAEAKGLELEVTSSGDLPSLIHSDPTRMRQVVVNLVGNAVKFTAKGKVGIHLECLAEDQLLRVTVRDSGIGLTPKQLEEVRNFQAFRQADSSVTRRFGGTGLGLRISKALAMQMGGGIQVDSVHGEGSVFQVDFGTGSLDQAVWQSDLRLEQVPIKKFKALPPRDGELALAKCRILYAEDGAYNRRLIQAILEKAGAQVTLCENGKEAVQAMQDLSGDPPDLILMDMQMPIMDGYQASQRLRELGFATPIVALTAHAMEGERQRCLKAGCDDYLTKPIDRALLLGTCQEWGAGRRRHSA